MQQRGVIVTAIVLALILAGALWYTMTRTQEALTPSPTPQIAVTTPPLEVPVQLPTAEQPPVPAKAVSDVHSDIAPSAPAGTTENLVILAIVAAIVGLVFLGGTIYSARQT